MLCHALYLMQPRLARLTTVYEKSVAALREHDRGRVRDRRPTRRLPRRLAPRQRASTRARAGRAGARAGARARIRRDVAADGELRRRRRHDRPLDRGARDDPRAARRPPASRRLPRLVPPLRVRRRRDRSGRARRAASTSSTRRSGSSGCVRSTSTTPQAPLGSNRDRHANILEGELGEKIGVFLANPRLQGLPAVLETAGPDGHGPDAAELQKTKDLHARSLACPRPSHVRCLTPDVALRDRPAIIRDRRLRRQPCCRAMSSAGHVPVADTGRVRSGRVRRRAIGGSCSARGRSRRRRSPRRRSACRRSAPR